MKHLLSLTTLATTSLLLAACLPGKSVETTAPQTESQVQQEAFEVSKALAAGKSVMCTITQTQTGSTSTYYHKGTKMKVLAQAEGETPASTMISDGEFFYVWEDAATTGMKFAIPDPSATPNPRVDMPDVPDFSKENAEEEYTQEGYTLDCKEKALEDSEFVPPTSVTFQDTSKMMENSMQQMQQQLETQDSEMSAEQQEAVKQMMQQFGQ